MESVRLGMALLRLVTGHGRSGGGWDRSGSSPADQGAQGRRRRRGRSPAFSGTDYPVAREAGLTTDAYQSVGRSAARWCSW